MTKAILNQADMPKKWYNLASDLPIPPLPYLGPDGKPVTPEMMSAIFPMSLIEQEMTTQAEIEIPQEVQDVLTRWRPSPLHRAVAPRPAATNPTPPLRRPTTTKKPE